MPLTTSLWMATVDPFESWKHARTVWAEAKRRGMEVVVALDDRTSAVDRKRVSQLADLVIPWTSDGHCEDAFVHIQRCLGDYVFLLADDEEPSPLCWEFAQDPPFPARYGFPVIPYISAQRKVFREGLGEQERLVWKQTYRWLSRRLPDGTMTTFEGYPEGSPQVSITDNPGAVIWHYNLDAPREEREEKARRYARVDQSGVEWHRSRVIWEERPDRIADIPPLLRSQLPVAQPMPLVHSGGVSHAEVDEETTAEDSDPERGQEGRRGDGHIHAGA